MRTGEGRRRTGAPHAAHETLDRWGPLHRTPVGEKSATHGSPSAPSPAAIAGAMDGRPHSPTNCAPWGYPATNSPRGKAQAGDPLLRDKPFRDDGRIPCCDFPCPPAWHRTPGSLSKILRRPRKGSSIIYCSQLRSGAYPSGLCSEM
jgi:hypothetical protein